MRVTLRFSLDCSAMEIATNHRVYLLEFWPFVWELSSHRCGVRCFVGAVGPFHLSVTPA